MNSTKYPTIKTTSNTNALVSAVSNNNTSSFINPVRDASGNNTSKLLFYNTTTKELQSTADIVNDTTQLTVSKNITTTGTVSTNSITTTYSSLPTLTASQIGYVISAGLSSTVYGSDIAYSISSLTLPAGVWVITANLSVQSGTAFQGNISKLSWCLNNSTGMLQYGATTYPSLNIYFSSGSYLTGHGNPYTTYSNQIVHTVSLTASTTIYFNVLFAFFGSISVLTSQGGFMKAVRIA